MCGSFLSTLPMRVVMVSTVVTPRVILAGVAALAMAIYADSLQHSVIIVCFQCCLLSQTVYQDMMTMNTAGV